MTDVFLTVLRMSLTGSLVILGVLLVRLALKKAPKRWTWALWLIVLFRLLTPFGIPLSVPVPDFSPVTEAARIDTESSSTAESPDSAVPSSDPMNVGSASEVYAPDPAGNLPSEPPSSPAEGAESLPAASDPPAEADRNDIWDRVLTAAPFVWLAGAAVLTGWNLASYRSLKTRLSEAVPSGMRNVYLTDRVDSAFVVGLIRPKIYLPTGLTPVERACVAAHERTHIRRGDPWRRLLFFVALTVHWFNPLVWMAFSLSGKDMELSCDEAVLNRAMGRLDEQSDTSDADVRAAYAKTLVKFASRGRIGGPALAFGEGETGGRVKNVMKYKKPVLWVSVAAAAVLVFTGILMAVNFSARNTEIPHTRYTVSRIEYLYEQQQYEDVLEVLSRALLMLTGEDRLYVNSLDAAVWSHMGRMEEWIVSGEASGAGPGGIGGAEDLRDMLKESAGRDVGPIREARYRLTESNHPNGSPYHLLLSTSDGRVWFAFVVRSDSDERGAAAALLRLKAKDPVPKGDLSFFELSLEPQVRETLPSVSGMDVKAFSADRGRDGIFTVLFAAGNSARTRFEDAGDDTPFSLGAAVFVPSEEGRGLRLAGWKLCPDAAVTGPLEEISASEELRPGTFRRENGNRILFETETGETIRLDLTLPERNRTLFGKTEYTDECSIRFTTSESAPESSPSQSAEAPKLTEEELEAMYERQEAERQKEAEEAREDSLRQAREQIDAAYDAFLAEHYELEDMSSYLAAYATRRIDLNGDGWNELAVYRMPTESSYPLDIYEYHRPTGEVRAFHTALEGIPASLNADPSGFWCAQIGAHDPDLPDGFYGDFFTINDQTYLISMDGSEWWKKLECHAFTTVSDSLAADTVFSAERCGAFYYDEAKQNRSFVNGQEIPFDGYFDALTDWRETWTERMGGSAEIRTQTPLWNESEVSGWPIVWYPPPGTGIEQMWCTPDNQPLFMLTFPAEWEQNVTIRTGGAWADTPDDPDHPDNPVPLWIDFYDRMEQEKNGIGLLGSLALYPHAVDRFYPTYHEELMTLTAPDGESYDLVLTYPGDMQYWNYRDHYTYWQVRLRSVALRVKVADGIPKMVAPERAMRLLHDELVRAYENIYGPFEPLDADPTPEGAVGVEDSLWLRYVTTRLTLSDGRAVGAWEDEDFYWFPVIFPFAVDKRSGAVYKVYEGWDPAANEEYTQFTPFDPGDPNALAFAG